MNSRFAAEFEGLVEKYAELLTGDASAETVEKIKVWAIYNHIHKTMPALASHWNQQHPEGKADVRKLFEEVRDRNQKFKAANQQTEAPPEPEA